MFILSRLNIEAIPGKNKHIEEVCIESSSSLFLSHLTNYDQFSLQAGDLVFIPGLESSLLDDAKSVAEYMEYDKWVPNQGLVVEKKR